MVNSTVARFRDVTFAAPWIVRLSLIASFALLILVICDAWTVVRAQGGPALWFAATSTKGKLTRAHGVAELRPAQLARSGRRRPVTISESATTNAAGVAFQGGNLWVTTLDNTVLEFTGEQLANVGKRKAPTPAVTITSSSGFSFIIGCAFDNQGNLWVVDANLNPGGVHEISAAQLAQGSADVTPVVTIQANGVGSPAFATFDQAGNLWISGEASNVIAEIAANHLGTSGVVNPDVVLSSAALDGPGQMAFDSNGDLWVTNALNSTVAEFTPDQLAVSGSPDPAVILSSMAMRKRKSLDTPWGLQFDPAQNLWVYNYTEGALAEFTPDQITATGSPKPTVFLTGLTLYAAQMTFGPAH